MSKLILRALFSSDKFTFDKRYDSLNGEKGATIADGHWVKNDLGNYAFIPGNQIKTGLNDDGKTDFRFELMLQFDAPRLSDEIKEQVAKSIESACKPGGIIHSAFKGYPAGGLFSVENAANSIVKNSVVSNATITNAAQPKKNGMHTTKDGGVEFWSNGVCKVRVGGMGINKPTVQEIKANEHDKAVDELDKYLPAYRQSGKGFQLSESVEWLGKLNAAHQKDCIKYEAIIENLMEAFDIKTHDRLADLAQNLVKSKRVIDKVNKAK
ncbi:hypothetical protein [Enterobacter phage Phc]|nr:hypothetical protein [Enterobacter phage Phc]